MRRALISACLAAFLAGTAAQAEIASARYDDETSRYPHGVLGDAVEYETLVVTLRNGSERRANYRESMVFEDIAPRLVDLDGDGAPEVITVESHENRGARLAVWGWKNDGLTPIVATPFIGQRFRWLAPVGEGAVDIDGDGFMELAYIDRPHLAKTLRVWRYTPTGDSATLTEVANMGRLTNHRIGEDFISGGIRTCGPRPEFVLADATWENIMLVWMHEGKLRARAVDDFTAPPGFANVLACRGAN